MKEYALKVLLEENNKAIKNGNEFKGFLGVPPSEFNKEQLEMVCNILYDKLRKQIIENSKLCRL